MSHPTFERLSDFVGEALPPTETHALRAHLATCEDCARQVASLTALACAAASLPRDVAPPPGLWEDIETAIATGGGVPRVPQYRDRFRWRTPAIAAAAVLIAILSSALTTVVLRRQGERSTAVATLPASNGPRTALPASLASAEHGYEQSVHLLERTLAERRDSLAPSTVAVVERSLRVADSAIAEARSALARDPSNTAIARLFASNYERKIDLLRRAAELAPRT